MLLITFLGLIAKLALVSCDCDVGTQEVKNFDFTKAKGTWYVLKHSPNDFENALDCVVVNYGPPEGNMSLITKQADFNSSHIIIYGNATNWNDTGFDENYQPPNIWNGRYYVIAIDYDSYVILKHCPANSTQPNVYVAYRCQHPDKETVNRARTDFQENKIAVNQLVDWPANNCQQAESSTEGRCSAKRHRRRG